MKRIFLAFGLLLTGFGGFAQNLLDEVDDFEPVKQVTKATFETTRIINGHSIINPAKHELLFIISHRFGEVNSGLKEFFGLDQSNIRIGLDYGVTKRLGIGIGRSSNPKTLDGFAKYKILEQSTGKVKMPLSVSLVGEFAWNIGPWLDPNRDNKFQQRFAYTWQLLIARKFSKRLSLQLSPTLVHKNLVPLAVNSNDIFVLASGGRFKVTNHLAVNLEYGLMLPITNIPDYAQRKPVNSLSVGVDLETGGHVFQFFLTNSLACFGRGIWTETTNSWTKGGIHLGFNIMRSFTLGKHDTQ